MKRLFIQAACATGCAIAVLVGCSVVGAHDSGGVRLDRFQQGLLDQVHKTLNAKDPFSAASCKPDGSLDSEVVEVFKRGALLLADAWRDRKVDQEREIYMFNRHEKRASTGVTLVVVIVNSKCSTFKLNRDFFDPPVPSGKP